MNLNTLKTILLTVILLQSVSTAGAQNSVYPVLKSSDNEIDQLIEQLQYTAAEEKIKKLMTQAKRRRQDTTQLELQLNSCNRGMQTLRGTDQIVVIDSVVVDKRTFLQAYNISDELGTVSVKDNGRATEFQTQRGNMLYTVEETNGNLQLYSYYIENGKRTEKRKIYGLGIEGDCNYPFLMADGSTLYFAARSADGLGNYDLYVTRYDYEDNRYYKAESLGFPYNSYANDYMMVVDEERNLGWFASDRYQPEGKVCIYTFIPNQSRNTVDFENTDISKVITLARLSPIKTTWTKENKNIRQQAQQQIDNRNNTATENKENDFTLIINDQNTYHYFSDFHSLQARAQCRTWLRKSKELTELNNKIESLRNQYRKYKNEYVKSQILNLEQQIEQQTIDVKEAEKLTRNTELQNN